MQQRKNKKEELAFWKKVLKDNETESYEGDEEDTLRAKRKIEELEDYVKEPRVKFKISNNQSFN
jgi:hypothetical protein